MLYFSGYLWACWAALSISFPGDLCRESLHGSSLRRRQNCLGCEVPGKYSSICKLRVPPGKHYKREYVCACVLSCNQFFAVLWAIAARLLCVWDSPGKNAVGGSHFLLQGNLPNWGIEAKSPALQADSLWSDPPGKPTQATCLCTNKRRIP